MKSTMTMKTKILEGIYNLINYIDEKLGYVERIKSEEAPYCGHGYTIFEGKFTREIYHDVYTTRYTTLPIWNIGYDDHVNTWYIFNTFSLTVYIDYAIPDKGEFCTLTPKTYYGIYNSVKEMFKSSPKLEGFVTRRRFKISLFRK